MQEDVKEFTPGYFTQQGVRTETNKQMQKDPSFSRMMNPKLKNGNVQKKVRIIVGTNAVPKNLLRQLVDIRMSRVRSQKKPDVR